MDTRRTPRYNPSVPFPKEPEFTERLRALADPSRLRVLHALRTGPLPVGRIATGLNLPQPAVSRHLGHLFSAGLVSRTRHGVSVEYRFDADEAIRPLLEMLLSVAERQGLFRGDAERLNTVSSRESTAAASAVSFAGISGPWREMKADVLGNLDVDGLVLSAMTETDLAVDLGCGSGELLPVLARKAASVLGVDVSLPLLEEARTRCAGNRRIDLRLGELTHLPLGDGEAGFASLIMALHHAAIPQNVLAEAGRILRRKGRLVLVDFAQHKNPVAQSAWSDRWTGFDRLQLTFWLEKAGFHVQKSSLLPLVGGMTLLFFDAQKRSGGRL